jgi:hypothetical protein
MCERCSWIGLDFLVTSLAKLSFRLPRIGLSFFLFFFLQMVGLTGRGSGGIVGGVRKETKV